LTYFIAACGLLGIEKDDEFKLYLDGAVLSDKALLPEIVGGKDVVMAVAAPLQLPKQNSTCSMKRTYSSVSTY